MPVLFFLFPSRPISFPTTMPVLFFLFLVVLPLLPPSTPTSTPNFKINVWPKPTSIHWPQPTFAALSPSFRIHHRPDRVLSPASRRYLRLLLSERHHPILIPSPIPQPLSPPLHSLIIHINNPPFPSREDESYALRISPLGFYANLSAPSPLGALRGLETFSQLAFASFNSILLPSGIDIRDAPRFSHRGVLLDTSRNFYSVKDIKRTVGAMAMNKLNVLHWHLTDSHSFPVVLPRVPVLGEKGAYGEGMRYSAEDVKEVVRFATRRGVRVVPEFDAPGHTGSWANAFPEIVACANRFWAPQNSEQLAAEPGTGQLNPLHPKTYEVYHNVLRDAADLFPDSYIHGGADEVSTACWETDASIQQFLANGGTHSQLLEIFINSTHPFITGPLGRTAVYWEDVLLGTVRVDPSLLPPSTTILQTWNYGLSNAKHLVTAGYRTIVSSADYYYLDCGHGGWVGNDSRYNAPEGFGGSWCEPYKTWQRVYDFDITEGMEEEEARRVLGGEVALWSEQADGTVVDGRLWPRTAAFAEAMWSGNRDENGGKAYSEATDRLHEWSIEWSGGGSQLTQFNHCGVSTTLACATSSSSLLRASSIEGVGFKRGIHIW